MTIAVVNKFKHRPTIHDVYIGRPGILGNPYSHLDAPKTIKVANREIAVESYRKWLANQLSGDGEVSQEIERLAKYYMEYKQLNLVCFCKNDKKEIACHGDIIRECLLEIVGEEEK